MRIIFGQTASPLYTTDQASMQYNNPSVSQTIRPGSVYEVGIVYVHLTRTTIRITNTERLEGGSRARIDGAVAFRMEEIGLRNRKVPGIGAGRCEVGRGRMGEGVGRDEKDKME